MLDRVFPWLFRPRHKKDEPFGLLQLYPPPEYTRYTKPGIEIIAIHGLGGNRLRSFTKDDNIWLKDFLPENPRVIPLHPKVSTFGYDASVAFGKSVSKIRDFAFQLLNELERTRLDSQTTGVPIVFVAHSVGGIVAKAALIIAHEREEHYRDIKACVKGIVFMGTPHVGSDLAAATKVLRDIANVVAVRTVRKDLLKALEPKSQELQDIAEQFVHRGSGLEVVSIYEQMLTRRVLVVDRLSATLGVSNERLVAIPRNHSGICKYSRQDEGVYAMVSGAVVSLLENIHRNSCT
ncbi:hypothetical protein BDD12DRAFT_486815 [Trichophaea hybrida]|nr:hypothetical protein BDD12DRAFT_486815 [Trichophaea hybrida]